MTRNWTQEEIEFLSEEWGYKSVGAIAKKIGRGEQAVVEKAHRLKLGPHLSAGDRIPLLLLIQTIYGYADKGSCSYKAEQWKKWGLPVVHHHVWKNRFQVVNIDVFWEWAADHQNLMNFARFEECALGKEPEWVRHKRQVDSANRVKRKTPWTPEEDQLLRDLLNEFRYDYATLTKFFNRSENAIKRRIYDLGIKAWPIRSKPKPWTDAELKMLSRMRGEGYAFSVISERIGRSEHSCRGKFENMMRQREVR